MSVKFRGAYFPIVTSTSLNLINSCNVLQRLHIISLHPHFLRFSWAKIYSDAFSSDVRDCRRFKASSEMLARTNAFSRLFARLLQNASIKGGLNSCAKREERNFLSGQIARHKFVCRCLGAFAVDGTLRCRKLNDKLGIFKYFPLVLADLEPRLTRIFPRWTLATCPSSRTVNLFLF